MSRSKRKDIIKDKPNNCKASTLYWRPIRRIWKVQVNKIHTQEDIVLSHQKQIINDYDYCDYIFRDCGEKYKRK